MQYINIDEGKLHIVFGITDKDQIKLLHFSAAEFDESTLCKEPQFIDEMFQLVQINFSGYNRPYEKHGNKHIVTAPGYTLTYKDMQDTRNAIGRRLVITQTDKETGAYVVTTWQFYEGTQIVRMWNEVFNEGTETQTLEYLSSFYYAGIEKEGNGSTDEKLELRICH
ncbi:MAG: alpha-galactosidase, partial [Lachnospiraceae bacterium]|nr:alpha-galactosidase [Lachnospiraceae bacterium]